MRPSRVIVFWSVVITILVILELAELTHLFTLGYAAVLNNPLAFIFSLLLITILALVGALFVGIYIAHAIMTPGGFTPFEEEMLKMRENLKNVSEKVDAISERLDKPKGPQ
jgi:hypothetical protein